LVDDVTKFIVDTFTIVYLEKKLTTLDHQLDLIQQNAFNKIQILIEEIKEK